MGGRVNSLAVLDDWDEFCAVKRLCHRQLGYGYVWHITALCSIHRAGRCQAGLRYSAR